MQAQSNATLLLWVAVLLAVVALAVPWATKDVDEVRFSGDGQTAMYRLGGLEIHWETINAEGERRPGSDFVYYDEDLEDLNLPGGVLLRKAELVAGIGAGAVFLAAAAHGFRPGPRRRRIGSWLVVSAGAVYFATAAGALAAMAMHAQGWHARQVGPFIPWTGTFLAGLACFALFQAIMRMALFSRPAEDAMPALPGAEGALEA